MHIPAVGQGLTASGLALFVVLTLAAAGEPDPSCYAPPPRVAVRFAVGFAVIFLPAVFAATLSLPFVQRAPVHGDWAADPAAKKRKLAGWRRRELVFCFIALSVIFFSAVVVFAFVIILGAQGFARYCFAVATCYAVAFLLTPTCMMVSESGRRPGADAS